VTFASTLHIQGKIVSGFIKRIVTELEENTATGVHTPAVEKYTTRNHNMTDTSEFIKTRKGLPATTVIVHFQPKGI
jgi:hypothetical protein